MKRKASEIFETELKNLRPLVPYNRIRHHQGSCPKRHVFLKAETRYKYDSKGKQGAFYCPDCAGWWSLTETGAWRFESQPEVFVANFEGYIS